MAQSAENSSDTTSALTTFYVSATGSDENSGLSTTDAFATVTRARNAIRESRTGDTSKRCVVVISEGEYPQPETLVLGDEDSNTEYVGEGAGAVLSGGIRFQFQRLASAAEKELFPANDAEIWVYDLPKVDDAPLFFEQLFVNGRRAVRSRFPNDGFLIPESIWEEFPMNPQTRSVDHAVTPQELRARTGDLDDLKLEEASTEVLSFAQFIVHHNWDTTRRIIRSYDKETRALRCEGVPMKSWNPWRDSSLYYLENLPMAFDQPGEWFYDGVNERVFYRPLEGEQLNQTSFIAPVSGLNCLLDINGSKVGVDEAKKTTSIRFRNVQFSYTDAASGNTQVKPGVSGHGPTQFEPLQAAAFTTGTVRISNASDIIFERCRVKSTGEYAFVIMDCSDCQIIRTDMEDLGAGGVRIGDGSMDRHNQVVNCNIVHGGRFFASGTAVWIGQNTEDTLILHNEIADFFYTGVSAGWVWGYNGGHAFRNCIEYNHIHHIGQGALADMGGVYTLGRSTGTRVCNNVIHDVDSYGYGGWGLYPDEGSEGILFENNLVYDVTDGSFHQHYGKENILRNNILARSKKNPAKPDQPAHQIAVSRIEDHLSVTIERNIIYWKDGVALGYNANNAKVVYDSNLWYNATSDATFGGLSHEEWVKTTGKDVNGIVADPLFVDPDANDFRLKSGSPAQKIGFVPFDYTQAGVQPE
ncbi:MAG: right-handed parallel beta-helix repeat-containing protein [Planctomycetia bacterium]|nr:right-handed parallel beta-helix repeat-containing protein [Planctomycetia bacterium]